MADLEPFLNDVAEGERTAEDKPKTNPRVASIDVFRGFSVFLMILVDYAGSVFPIIAHCPWNGIHLAEFVMPFFLFISGVSVALVYGKASDRVEATWKAMIRAIKLFLLGLLLQGGYFHGITSLTYGVDLKRIRWLGILQRISIGYIVAALCEIWLSCGKLRTRGLLRSYYWQWCIALLLSGTYLGLSNFLYVPDWQYKVATSSAPSSNITYVYKVKCAVRGDLGPACNSAGMIDRVLLGIDHLYKKPVFHNLKECTSTTNGLLPENVPSWCHAPYDPEGILSSFTAAVACIVALQYGHILVQIGDHRKRLCSWSIFSVSLLVLGLFLTFIGFPVNKSLYTISYTLLTTGSAGITFCAFYVLVDVYGYRSLTYLFELIGKHSLSIFVLVTSNLLVIMIQGFYLNTPDNNIVRSIVRHFVQK